jgi:pilus assembly protein CpaF
MSWEVIIPFLRPIENLIRDPDISDIMVNGGSRVFIEKFGHLKEVPEAIISEKSLQVAVRNIARVLGDDISEEMPLLDARLPDGSRVAAIFPPCSVTGTILTIRKFHAKRYSADELARTGTLTLALLKELREAIENRRTILISGGTGTGKTTLLNALGSFIPDTERIVVIEDTSELQVAKPNLVRLEARREQGGLPAVTMRDLLRTSLRLRPDRILIGEVRGGEAFDLLQALNTGHAGSLSTIHANSAEQALSRFTNCVLQSGIELPYTAIRANIGEVLSLIIHIDRRHGQRFVSEVLQMKRYLPDKDRYELLDLFKRE